MLRKKSLIGCHNMSACAQCSFYRCFSRTFVAADQFDEHIDIGLLRQFDGIIKPLNPGKIYTAIPSSVAGADSSNRYLLAALTSEHFGLVT